MTDILRRALIFGVTGQDGALLAQHLLAQGCEVHGASRRWNASGGNLRTLGILDSVRAHTVDPVDEAMVAELIDGVRPSEVYNLSGQSSVGLSFAQPSLTFDSHVGSTMAILEAIRVRSPGCRFFHASSGEIFGGTGPEGADESTALAPCTPYGAAKAAATLLVGSYRKAFGLYACSGFLFNHESPLRSASFVTQRIAHGAAAIKMKRASKLSLGNLQVVRDWGWAADYVECMAMMLRQPEPRDYVIASGVGTPLESFVERVFSRFNLDWKECVVRDEALVRPTDIEISVGNPRAAQRNLGWRARVGMPEVAYRLADAALVQSQR
jgi:GDPmannose 4,6-dehydratase